MFGFALALILVFGGIAVASVATIQRWLKRLFGDLLIAALTNVEAELSSIKSMADLSLKVKALREELEALQIASSRKQEEYARREREIEHKVGLERKRQELELSAAKREAAADKREATLAVREENLAADRKRFEDAMAFHDERFSQEVGYLKSIIGDLAERLPQATISTKVRVNAEG